MVKVGQPVSGSPATELVPDPNARPNWSATQHGRLCSLLSLHQILDLLAFMKNLGGNVLVKQNTLPMPESKKLPVWVYIVSLLLKQFLTLS